MTEQGLPGEYRSRFTVTAPVPLREGGALKGFITYVGTLRRLDARWWMELQWVDLENQGHRDEFPHEAVAAMFRSAGSIIKRARSDRGKRAAETAKARGVIPFQRKEEPAYEDLLDDTGEEIS